jgi:glycosyltransferase involved in cell wall biosynthesis
LEILRKFGNRISVKAFEENKGAAIATNFGIKYAKNPYIAILNSDDMWELDKLELQYSWMIANNFDISFTTASIIDSESRVVQNPPSYFDVFLRTQPVNQSFLYHFFYFGNFLCHPSLLIKREIYFKHGFYSNKFRQLPDLERWIEFTKHSGIGILDKKLVKFRWTEGSNTSSQDITSNYLRTQNEHFPMYLNFFNNVSDAEIRKIFSKEFECMDSALQSIAAIDPGSALLLSHPETSVKYQTTMAAYLRLMQNEKPLDIDKYLQELSSTFQVKIDFENLTNRFMEKSYPRQVFDNLPIKLRRSIGKWNK